MDNASSRTTQGGGDTNDEANKRKGSFKQNNSEPKERRTGSPLVMGVENDDEHVMNTKTEAATGDIGWVGGFATLVSSLIRK